MNIHLFKSLPFFKRIVLSLFMVLTISIGYSQKKTPKNLIPNSSFESSVNKRGDINNAAPWIGIGTVDYYVKPEKRDTSRYKGARTGNCYAGLRFQKEYKEYMYVPLTETLQEGKTYHFEMYARLLNFDNVTVTLKQLGGYFSEEPFTEDMPFYKENMIDTTNENGISGTLNWIPIRGDYTANGGEKYVIIGNFRPKMKDDFVKKGKTGMFTFEEGYYYIDDVSLYPKSTAGDTLKKKATASFVIPDSFASGQVIEIKNIQFEEGGTRILKGSTKVLNGVVSMLNNHPFMEIQINVKMDNQPLAKQRAKAIQDYLKEQGVLNPLKHKGLALSNSSEKNGCITEIVILNP